jgi:DNA-binding transcriptional ArsR family regulator
LTTLHHCGLILAVTNAGGALTALGDPTRRSVLEALRAGQRSVGEITAGLDVTQSAVSQHLRVLKEAGLVRERRDGTRRLYRVDLEGLAEVRHYLDGFWDDVLAAFLRHAEGAAPTGGAVR